MTVHWTLDTWSKPLIEGVETSYWPLVLGGKLSWFWEQTCFAFSKPMRIFFIALRDSHKCVCNPSMKRCRLFPPEIYDSVRSRCAKNSLPEDDLGYVEVGGMCLAIASLMPLNHSASLFPVPHDSQRLLAASISSMHSPLPWWTLFSSSLYLGRSPLLSSDIAANFA